MKTRLILVSLLVGLLAGAVENTWIENNGQFISSNKLILKFNDDQSPKLGKEAPLTMDSRAELSAVLAGIGIDELKPLFRSFETFNEKHYEFGLHQYYIIEFLQPVDVFTLKEQIETISAVELVDLNHQVNVATVPDDQYYPEQWAHDNYGQAGSQNVGIPDCDMDTDQAWDITTGNEEVIIAILDTGINNHTEFTGRLLPGYNSVNGGNNTTDNFGHGTQCAGISAARGNNGVGVAGVAWESLLLPIKVLTDGGSGDQVGLADGIQWATDNGADVISMSLQFGQNFVNVTNNAINFAVNNGTVVLAASANFNEGVVTYPARYDNCIAVGGLSPCNERKSYSSCDGESYWGASYGEDLDFVTPCVLIPTTSNTGGYTQTFNGTSAACPAAAGVAALVLSLSETITPQLAWEIMNDSCDDIDSPGWDVETGHGRLNAFQAVTLAFEYACENTWVPGDVNNDLELNVLDLVFVANMIIGIIEEPEICQEWAADFDNNEIINVLDIIQIINIIVN